MGEDNTYVLSGPEPHEPFPEGTLGEIIYHSLTHPTDNKEAFVEAQTGATLTFRTLLEKSCSIGEALRLYGCTPGTPIAICSENCLEFFVPVVSALLVGCTVVPLNPIYTPQELQHLLTITTPKVVFCSHKVLQKFVEAKKTMSFIEKLVVIDGPANGVDADDVRSFVEKYLGKQVDPLKFKPVGGDPSKLGAFIMSSSGTTGLPKGVMISHKNVAMKIAHARDPRYRFDYLNVMAYLPFFHGYGLNLCIQCIVTQHRLIFLRRFEEDQFLKTIEDYKIAVIPMAPPTAVFLSKTPKFYNYDLSSVKVVHCGAAPLSKYTEESLKKRLKLTGVTQGYGLTEAYEGIAKMPKEDNRFGSCGKLMTFVQCKIRDPETGKCLGPNNVGEICLKGPMVMMGYHGNPQATKETFTSDGWLRTGDLGYYDEEEYFYIVDRLKELIKYNGYQVAPAELESILIKHPQVVDVAVVGLPDESAGELPLAFIVKRRNCPSPEKEFIEFVASQVSPQKRLRGGVIFTSEIPKNASGKKLRKVLRERVKNMSKSKL